MKSCTFKVFAVFGLLMFGLSGQTKAQTAPSFSDTNIAFTFIQGTVASVTIPEASGDVDFYLMDDSPLIASGYTVSPVHAETAVADIPIVFSTTASTPHSGGNPTSVEVYAFGTDGSSQATLVVSLLVLTPVAFPPLGPFVFYPDVASTNRVDANDAAGLLTDATLVYSITPALPNGLALNLDTVNEEASIQGDGTAVAMAATNYTLTVRDASSATDTAEISIRVAAIEFPQSAYQFTFTQGVASSQALPTASGLQDALRYAVDDASLITGAGLAHSTFPSTTSGAPIVSSTESTPLNTDGVTLTLSAYHDSNGVVGTTQIQLFVVEAASGEHLAPVNEEVITKVAGAMVDGALGAIAERIAAANSATALALIGGQTPVVALASYAKAAADDIDDNNALLANSRFVLPFAALPSNANIGAMWGSVQMRELDGDVDAVDWSGDVSGLHLGVDYKIGDNLIGVAVSQNDADIDYKTPNALDAQGNPNEGQYEIELTALHPYINRRFGDVDAWAIIGLGEGEMTVTEKGDDAIKSDLSLTALGAGAAMKIVPSLQLRIEAHTANIDIEGNAARGLLKQALNTNSTRAMARWHNIYLTPTVPLFTALHTAFFEAGMRRDSGDGETRRDAMEAALGWQYHGQRAEIESAVHGLFGRKDYREWGAYINLRVSGGDDGQGLSLRVRPSYGESQSEFGRVWNAESLDDIVESNSDNAAHQWRTETRLSYGIQSAGGLVAPFVDAITVGNAADAADNTYRLGVDWSPHRYFDVNLTGERRHGNDDADERRVSLQGEVKF